MPFYSKSDLDGLSQEEAYRLMDTTVQIGSHPNTRDYFLIPDLDRYSGMYVLGVQGVGKSSLIEVLVHADLCKEPRRPAVIVIDPHGDLVDHIIAQMNLGATDADVYPGIFLFDMQDEAYPFGVNIFSGQKHQSSVSQAQAVDRVMHIFEVLW